MKEINIKLVLVGDSGVGKSTFLKRKVDDVFHSSFLSTIGVDFNTQYFFRQNYKIRTSIWDTAGQEKFSSLIEVYYRNLTAALIFYDTTNKGSFENINKWLKRVKQNNEYLPVYIIGTKTDLNDEREIFVSDLEQYKSDNILIFECSSKTNYNIKEIFETVIDNIFNKIKKKELLPLSNHGIKVYNNNFRQIENLEISDDITPKKTGCCSIL
jgi:Ras-related protein Rab-11A